MIVVIESIKKMRCGGGYFKSADDRKVVFVADPDLAPKTEGVLYVRPDDLADSRETWRQRLVRYNSREGNALGFYKAHRLYQTETYTGIADKFGLDRTFILSPCWGLIKAAYFTPEYKIAIDDKTRLEKPCAWRNPDDSWNDFNHLPAKAEEPLVFFGHAESVGSFRRLTAAYAGPRIIFYQGEAPDAPDCVLQPYRALPQSDWPLVCAIDFAAGKLPLAAGLTAPPKTPAVKPPGAADFRRALKTFFAAAGGKKSVDLRSCDLHRLAGPGAATVRSMTSCCKVMREVLGAGDQILESPPGGSGSNLVIRYIAPRRN